MLSDSVRCEVGICRDVTCLIGDLKQLSSNTFDTVRGLGSKLTEHVFEFGVCGKQVSDLVDEQLTLGLGTGRSILNVEVHLRDVRVDVVAEGGHLGARVDERLFEQYHACIKPADLTLDLAAARPARRIRRAEFFNLSCQRFDDLPEITSRRLLYTGQELVKLAGFSNLADA